VAFEVHIAQQVVEYIDTRERLTPDDRARIFAGIGEELGTGADRFLARNLHPFLPDSFWYDYMLMTEAHEVRQFRFACDGRGHVYGVTEVLYAEEWFDDPA
jgi:hypothetical protein